MPTNWLNKKGLSFNSLLLLERVQIGWLPGWFADESDIALALRANPVVAWYLEHKCPPVRTWLEKISALASDGANPKAIAAAEERVLAALDDLLVYALDPAVYDAQPFLHWDSNELTSLVDFTKKTVLDIGAGTGRLGFTIAPVAKVVFMIEPVANLRYYLREKAQQQGFRNVYPQDGLITAIPFPDGFADIVISGHVYGDQPEEERCELERVTRPGGMVILCPGNADNDNAAHQNLVGNGYHWSRFEEPWDGWRRKYWKVIEKGVG